MSQVLRQLSCVLLLTLLAACAPGNPAALRQSAGQRIDIVVERDIRSVYKSLRAGLDECAGRSAADLFESEGQGWIKMSGPGLFAGEAIWLYYDLTAQGAGSTRIEGYAAPDLGLWTGRLQYTERWAKGETGCPDRF